MSSIEPSRSRTPRRQREQRAYRLVLATAGFGAIAIIGIFFAIFGVIGAGFPILSGIIAIVCLFLFRRTVKG